MRQNPDEAFEIIMSLSLEAKGLNDLSDEIKKVLDDIYAVARYKFDVINYRSRASSAPFYRALVRETGDESGWTGPNVAIIREDIATRSSNPEGEYVLRDQWGKYWELDGITEAPSPPRGLQYVDD